jgi:hypothetical protein
MSRARENADLHDGSTNITTLGTVTAGNISHANIVYPVGHVVGFGYSYNVTAGGQAGGSKAQSYEAVDTAQITYTPKAAGNLLVLNGSPSGYLDNRSRNLFFTWYAGSSNIASTAISSGGMGQNTDYLRQNHEYGGTANDDFPVAGDVTGFWKAQNTNETVFAMYWKLGEDDDFHFAHVQTTLMEIQQ